MGFYFVDPETYKKYKDEVLSYSQSVQVNTQEFLPEDKRKRPLSDKEIAVKMGLDERVVREIRVVAERMMNTPLTNGKKPWNSRTRPAVNTPGAACLRFTKKYLKK